MITLATATAVLRLVYNFSAFIADAMITLATATAVLRHTC